MDSDLNQVEVQNCRNGYTWTAYDIDELIVGRIYGGFNFHQILLYIRLNNPGLIRITAAELERFWNDVLVPGRYQIARWTALFYEHPEVQRVLNRIRAMIAFNFNICRDLIANTEF